MFGTSIPEPRRYLPPPPPPATKRYAPLINYRQLFAGKELSDYDKETVIVLAQAGIAPKWPPNKIG